MKLGLILGCVACLAEISSAFGQQPRTPTCTAFQQILGSKERLSKDDIGNLDRSLGTAFGAARDVASNEDGSRSMSWPSSSGKRVDVFITADRDQQFKASCFEH